MKRLAEYIKQFALGTTSRSVGVKLYNDSGLGFAGLCGGETISINVAVMRITDQLQVDQLLIHECAHLKVSDHLTSAFYDECCRIGARLRTLEATLR